MRRENFWGRFVPWRLLYWWGTRSSYCWADLVSWKNGGVSWDCVAKRERCAEPHYQVGGSCYCGMVRALKESPDD